MSNLLKKITLGSLLAFCTMFLQAMPVNATCSTNCNTLGYVMDSSKCDPATILKCPFDNSKVYCKEKSCEELGMKTCNSQCIQTSQCCTSDDCGRDNLGRPKSCIGNQCLAYRTCGDEGDLNLQMNKLFNTNQLANARPQAWRWANEMDFTFEAYECIDGYGSNISCQHTHWNAYYLGLMLDDACTIVSTPDLKSKYYYSTSENPSKGLIYNKAKCEEFIRIFNDQLWGIENGKCSQMLATNKNVVQSADGYTPDKDFISASGNLMTRPCMQCPN